MGNPFEDFVRKFVPSGVEPTGDQILNALRVIEHSQDGLHGKLDHLYRRIETMDAHIKALSDTVNGVVTALNTLGSNLASHLAALHAGLSAEDADGVDAATAGLAGVLSNINTLNASLAAANAPVAAQSGGQATPAVAAAVPTAGSATLGKPDAPAAELAEGSKNGDDAKDQTTS